MSAGVVVNAGFVDKGSTWDSSESTVTDWLPATSETLTETPTHTRSAALGQVSQYKPELTRLAVSGDLMAEYDYNYGHGLLEYALGANASGTYSTADQLPYFGLEIDKGVSRWRFSSVCVQRLVISGRPTEEIGLTYGLVAYVGSRVATAFPSIRPSAANQERAVFEHAVVRLADTAGAIGSGDVVGVQGFELTLENTMKADDSDSASAKRVLAPERNGFRTGTLRLDFSRYSSAFDAGGSHPLETWKASNTELQADIVLTGSSGSLTIRCPIMHLSEGGDANVGGPEVIQDSATFELSGGVNANMSGDQLELVAA